MEKFEDYVTDQFPLRDQWIQLKAYSERALGKQENNKVYFGTDGQTLFAQFNAPSPGDLEQRFSWSEKSRLGERIRAAPKPKMNRQNSAVMKIEYFLLIMISPHSRKARTVSVYFSASSSLGKCPLFSKTAWVTLGARLIIDWI